MTRRRGDSGQALALFAGGLAVLLTMTGLVVDGGTAFFNRRQAQNAADLSSLAGTHVIADHYTKGGRSGAQVYDAIGATATDNGCLASGDAPCSWTATYWRPSGAAEQSLGTVSAGGSIPSGAQGIHVLMHRAPRTFFLGVIGQSTWSVDAESSALTARLNSMPPGQVLPIAVDPPNNNFKPGGIYELTAGMDAPGNFSWLSWTGQNSAGSLATSLCNPNNPEITFPFWIAGDPGKSNSSSVRACVDQWIDNKATVLLPIWDTIRGNGNNTEYHILGLAAFVLLAHGQPAIDTITARFVEYFPLATVTAGYGGPPCAPGSAGCADQVLFLGITR